MSDHKPPPAKVPDGVTPFYTTRQMPPNEKGFVGYETVWKPMQKEAEYKTPKKPQRHAMTLRPPPASGLGRAGRRRMSIGWRMIKSG
jgi:hypothetical protein